jgi:D-inositol-3-phosphate glycosyltransferase
MKVLFVLDNYFPFIGGAEVLFKHVCEGLAQKGHEVTVVTSSQPGAPKFEVINRVTIHRVNTPRKASRYWLTFLSIPLTIRLARSADVIHTTTYNGAFPAWLASRLNRKKCVITVHEVIGEGWKSMMGMNWFMAWLHQLLERIIIIMPFDRYISVSGYTARRIERYGVRQNKVFVVYPGIDYEMFDPHKANGEAVREKLGLKDKFIYMSYGRPGISKGLEYLVRAIPMISEYVPHSRLLMILGRRPEDGYKRISELIKSTGTGDRVTLIDPVPRDELASYIAAADCVVVPSISEGFGFTAIEGCAMGKPVVASNVASLPEVISGTNILVEPANSSAIAYGVQAVYNGNAVHTPEKKFNWSGCVDSYEGIYHSMAALKR